MAESESRPERVASAETGRMSHRRRARKRAGESAGALSDGTLEDRIARWVMLLVGITLLASQFVVTRIFAPSEMLRAVLAVAGVAGLATLVTWLDRVRSKKRNPKPRWLRGIIVAGFLTMSVVVGALIVLATTANPIEDDPFITGEVTSRAFTRSHVEEKIMQLKVLAFHITMTAAGMAMIVKSAGPPRHRRHDSGSYSTSSASQPKVSG